MEHDQRSIATRDRILRKPLGCSRMKRGLNREREPSRKRSQRFTGHFGGTHDGGCQSTSPRTRSRCESMSDQHCTSSSGWRIPLAGELRREGFRRTARWRPRHRRRSCGLLDCQGASGPVTFRNAVQRAAHFPTDPRDIPWRVGASKRGRAEKQAGECSPACRARTHCRGGNYFTSTLLALTIFLPSFSVTTPVTVTSLSSPPPQIFSW